MDVVNVNFTSTIKFIIMLIKKNDVLSHIDFGNSVAEFDKELERYFFKTDVFIDFINDKYDIVSGDKGTGKTALYRYVYNKKNNIPEMFSVQVIAGFNPAGTPMFSGLINQGVLEEGEYIKIWKAYFLSLVGNWLLLLHIGRYDERLKRLDSLLDKLGLRSKDEKPASIFKNITVWLKYLLKPKSIDFEVKIDSDDLMPVINPKIVWETDENEIPQGFMGDFDYDEAFELLNDIIQNDNIKVWVVLDRLDEAFIGYHEIEVSALRALFRTYLDMQAFHGLRLKIFVRKDLFRKIIARQFVNLTHVNARKKEIVWEPEDALSMLCKRIKEGPENNKMLSLNDLSDYDVLYKIFPEKIDRADRGQNTWSWILSRTSDGTNSVIPRNIIDLANMSKEEQIRINVRSNKIYHEKDSLIENEAIKKALNRLSEQRVDDTLFAEVSEDVKRLIGAFKGKKSEQNDVSISKLFNVDIGEASRYAKTLIDIGLFEEKNGFYKIPILYREGLNIVNGKAF